MNRKINFICAIILSLSSTLSLAQEIGPIKTSDYSYGTKHFAQAQRVYISGFKINFEFYKEAVDYKQGGGLFGRSKSSDATAKAAIGLAGIESTDIQNTTNRLYQEFLTEMTGHGFEIVTVDEAKDIPALNGWEVAHGPYVKESDIPGLMSAVPDNFSFLYDPDANVFSKIVNNKPKISKQLNDALVIDVNLYVMFSEDKQNLFKGKAAKVKVLINHRLVGTYAATVPKTEGLRFKGSSKVHYINSTIDLIWSKLKVGSGAMAQYSGTIKKPIEISGVIKKEKVVAYQKQGTSTPTSFSSYSHMDLADRFSTKAKWIDVDSKKFAESLYLASKSFIDTHLTEAFKKMGK